MDIEFEDMETFDGVLETLRSVVGTDDYDEIFALYPEPMKRFIRRLEAEKKVFHLPGGTIIVNRPLARVSLQRENLKISFRPDKPSEWDVREKKVLDCIGRIEARGQEATVTAIARGTFYKAELVKEILLDLDMPTYAGKMR